MSSESKSNSETNTESSCEILAFGPHPDDIELGCGGYLAKAAKDSRQVVISDLTRGELGSHGSVQERALEAEQARIALGAAKRIQLELPDGGLSTQDSNQVDSIVKQIRTLRPSLVLAPYTEARHPDHSAAGELITRATFLAALANYQSQLGTRHQVMQLAYYALRRTFSPSFIVDVTSTYPSKLKAIQCFSSQINRKSLPAATAKDPGPLISSPLSISSIEARDRFYGAQISVEYGEAFFVRTAIRIDDPLQHFNSMPTTGALLFDKDW